LEKEHVFLTRAASNFSLSILKYNFVKWRHESKKFVGKVYNYYTGKNAFAEIFKNLTRHRKI